MWHFFFGQLRVLPIQALIEQEQICEFCDVTFYFIWLVDIVGRYSSGEFAN